MHRYVLAIDQGTTGSTALVINEDFKIVGSASSDFPQHFPSPGLVEHDLNDIWASVCRVVSEAVRASGIETKTIAAIGITNQRETTCVWDAHGLPLSRAIVWQDRRTMEVCRQLRSSPHASKICRRTGLVIDPYFSATKIGWMVKHVEGLKASLNSGRAKFGTIDSFLLYRICGGKHATDVTNASRTLLMNLKTCGWDDELLEIFRVRKEWLPEILPSAVEYGRTKGFLDFPDGTPVSGIIGDQQSALFGQACFSRGQGKCTYGTGAFVLVNTGKTPVFSKNSLLTTVAWKLGAEATYCLEGSAFVTGAAVQWVRDGLGVIDSSPAIEALAESVPDSGGVVFVPALSGLGAPHWLPNATGLITGLTRGTTRAHIARATLEGIAFQVSELVQSMERDVGTRVTALKVDGGGAINKLLMQFQSDLLGSRIICADILETTVFGAALMAGLGGGIWAGTKEISERWRARSEYEPTISSNERSKYFERWNRAIRAVRLLSDEVTKRHRSAARRDR